MIICSQHNTNTHQIVNSKGASSHWKVAVIHCHLNNKGYKNSIHRT